MKKTFSMILFFAMIISFTTGLTIVSSALEGYSVDGIVSTPIALKTTVAISVTAPAEAKLIGIKIVVSYNKEKLTLIPEQHESDYFIGDLFPNQREMVSAKNSKITLMSFVPAGNEYNTFPGGTQNYVQLNFIVRAGTTLEEGDVSIEVTDAVNFNAETINNRFDANVIYKQLDTSVLEAFIKKAKELNPDVYTTDSFQAVQQALSIAETVLEKENVTQLEVDSATVALESAINNLIKVTIIGIEITAPTKVYYLMGEEFVADGFTVQNIYQNGKKEFTIGIYTVPNMNTIGVKAIDVTVGNFKGSFTIYVSTKGDINADGKVSLSDVMTAAKTAINTEQNVNSAEVIFGDVVGNDNKITLADVLMLAKASIGTATIN